MYVTWLCPGSRWFARQWEIASFHWDRFSIAPQVESSPPVLVSLVHSTPTPCRAHAYFESIANRGTSHRTLGTDPPLRLCSRCPPVIAGEITEAACIYEFADSRNPKVNHAFHALVRDSPVIQYEIDLSGAGLQRNPRTRAPLADCRTAFEAYSKRWEASHSIEQWTKDFRSSVYRAVSVVSGTFGILWKRSASFITLGSISRGIPRREWDISFKTLRARGFAFYPQADILAVIEVVART